MSTIEYLGCSPIYFKNYIQSKMTADMTFDDIHFDHIKPVSSFDLQNEEDILMCCHYSDFQPLLKKTILLNGQIGVTKTKHSGVKIYPTKNTCRYIFLLLNFIKFFLQYFISLER